MLRKIAVILLFFLIPGFLVSQEINFRSSDWGMSKAEVKEIESQELLQERGGSLYYTDTFQGHNMYVVYNFDQDEDRLTEGQYILQEELEKPAQYIDAFRNVIAGLTDQLGEARIDTVLFSSKEYMGKTGQYPEALQQGEIRFQAVWEDEGTQVITQLWNGKQIRLAVQYVDKSSKE